MGGADGGRRVPNWRLLNATKRLRFFFPRRGFCLNVNFFSKSLAHTLSILILALFNTISTISCDFWLYNLSLKYLFVFLDYFRAAVSTVKLRVRKPFDVDVADWLWRCLCWRAPPRCAASAGVAAALRIFARERERAPNNKSSPADVTRLEWNAVWVSFELLGAFLEGHTHIRTQLWVSRSISLSPRLASHSLQYAGAARSADKVIKKKQHYV